MKVEKKILSKLNKCYSIAPLKYKNNDYILTASEKDGACLLFDLDGNLVSKVWEGTCGVMTMVQVPNTDGQFLATRKFYSPNNSKEAELIKVTPTGDFEWEIEIIALLPFVHRFDILVRNGIHYLIACTLKSGHKFKDDWSSKGKIYTCELPKDLSNINSRNQLNLSVLMDGLLKNHGYYKVIENGIETSLITSENGIYQITPPINRESVFEINQLLNLPTSDATMIDIDGDGEKELLRMSPFHGPDVSIYKKVSGEYKKVYTALRAMDFTHAICATKLLGKPTFIVGHREGNKTLVAFTYDIDKEKFIETLLDKKCGLANMYHYIYNEKDIIIGTHREYDEVVRYEITK